MHRDLEGAEPLALRSPYLALQALAWGPRAGRPILALHGWLDNAASFARLAPRLARPLDGARFVALDLPGHGLSEARPPGVPYHFVDWIPDVLEAADALGWERFTLIGHSMGAGIASLVAGAAPNRVERLILLEGLGPLSDSEDTAPERAAAWVGERQRLPRREMLPYPDRGAAAAKLIKVVPNLSLESALLLLERGAREVDGGVVWSADARLRRTSPLRFTEPQVLAYLRRISAPTLLVWAEDGWPFPPPVTEVRAAALANVTVLRLPGGHHFHLEDPEPVAHAINAFLADALARPESAVGAAPR